MHKSQAGFIQLLVITLLLLGIGVGVYLIQFTQVFKPKASEGATHSSAANDGRFGSTPISDLAKYPRPQNHIQTMMLLDFVDRSTLDDTLVNYIAKEIDFWMLPGTGEDREYLSLAKRVKTINPQTRIIAGAPTVLYNPAFAGYGALTDQDFLHHPDGSLIADEAADKFANLPNSATVTKLANFWADYFNTNQLDGLFMDYYFPFPHAQNALFGRSCLEGACNSIAFWHQGLSNLGRILSSHLTGKDVIYNSISYYPPGNIYEGTVGPMGSIYTDDVTGTSAEHPEEMYINPDAFLRYLEVIPTLTAKGKKVIFSVEAPFLNPPFQTNALYPTPDLNLERYFLATYLLIQRNPYTYFGYHPGTLYQGDTGYYFYKDWNLDFGTPASAISTTGNPDLYFRIYTTGYAVVNNSTGQQPFSFAPGGVLREWDPVTGPIVSGTIMIPPKSGKFFFSQVAPGDFNLNPPQSYCEGRTSLVRLNWTPAFKGPTQTNGGYLVFVNGEQKYNNLAQTSLIDPVPKNYDQTYTYKIKAVTTAGETWSNEQSVTIGNCSAKTGDINDNGKIDIFDFNLLISDFGKKQAGLKTDLNHDLKVDIFDFNILVTNFGK